MSAGYSPMAVLSLAAQRDKSKLASGDAWILLLDIIWSGQHFRLARNVDPITFDAGDGNGPQSYQPFNFELSVEEPGGAQLPTMILRASNTMRILQGIIEQYAGVVGATANIYVYNTAHPAGEPDLAITSTVMKTTCSATVATLSLSAPSPMRQLFPRFLYRANFCMWVSNYKGAQCLYAGALNNCDGTYNGANGCVVHNNATRFGGFPGIGTNGIVLASQN
jgi:phage-related protein